MNVAIASLAMVGCLWGSSIEKIATYRGPGAIDGAVVGPGPTPGSQRLYLAYMYAGHTVDFVEVDPDTGRWQVFENPTKSEYGAITLLGPDGNIYLGTRPHAHIFRFNPKTGEYKDLGQPAPGEAYIWQLTLASDGRIYGCTYPSSKLVRYNPASGRLEDLGRMDPKELYGSTIAASDDGFVYEGIGTARAHLVAYQISTGKHRDILPAAVETGASDKRGHGNTAIVHKGNDGKIYAAVGKRCFLVKGWTAQPIPESRVHLAPPTIRLRDGRIVLVDGNQLLIAKQEPADVVRRPYTYPGREGDVFRLGAGPDKRIYGSSILPFHFFVVDPSANRLSDFGDLGHGEAYSLLSFRNKLYLAIYGGKNGTPLMAFDPAKPFLPGNNSDANPKFVTYPEANTGWRPQAIVAARDGKLYIGSVAGYGDVTGPLTVWDTRTNRIETIPNLAPGESIVSLAIVGDMLAGGTTIFGGGGSHPVQKEAKLLIWDLKSRRKVYETVPISGATGLTDLLALPDGKVMGIAGNRSAQGKQTLFVFDENSRKIEYAVPFDFKKIVYNSVASGPDGSVWGLAGDGIFRFDPRTRSVELAAKAPKPITAGFVLSHGAIYYASGPDVYRYRLPNGDQ